ncbi:hypothetical protein V2J09_002399 [Rumex salicifolius]
MWGSIANLKENLNKIALDVHDDDDDEELGIYGGGSADGQATPIADRRRSHSLAYSRSSGPETPLSNGFGSSYSPDIEQYNVEIKRLRESEAEIKALSVNYAALLKEKEDHIIRINQENSSLKKKLDATSSALNASKVEASRASATSPNASKGGSDQSTNRQSRLSSGKSRVSGNQLLNGVNSKQEGHGNGFSRSHQDDYGSKYSNLMDNEKELADLVEEKNRSLASMQANYEQQIKQLKAELQQEYDRSVSSQVILQDEQKRMKSLQEELSILKQGQDKTSFELNKLREELKDKEVEIRQLQIELSRKGHEEIDETGSLKRLIATIEKEKENLKREKESLEATLKSSTHNSLVNVDPSISFPGKEELESTLQKLEKDLKETRRQRDKASQELARLKQHLLQKESEESEKMDEDSKIIEELQEHVEYQKGTIFNLEKALKQAYAGQEELKNYNSNELKKAKETIADLKDKLAACMRTIDAKNVELLNLQTALGQYYAEIEAKERLENDLSLAREECSKLVQQLKDINQQFEVLKGEKEEISAKLMHTENVLAEASGRVKKLEEDNAKLRRALEQSMTRLNRMSMDSDFLVDRRIVIKLLVTYFQRNHSKEVLDLMVRMLGFSDEDKQRIGVAQQGGGKGVVRGVLGLPGRLVGGILSGGGSSGTPSDLTSDDHSFADLWVDFLLKESEKEKMESMALAAARNANEPISSPSASGTPPLPNNRTSKSGRPPVFLNTNPSYSADSRTTPPYTYPAVQQYEYHGSEFSTVPLTPSQSRTWDQSSPP